VWTYCGSASYIIYEADNELVLYSKDTKKTHLIPPKSTQVFKWLKGNAGDTSYSTEGLFQNIVNKNGFQLEFIDFEKILHYLSSLNLLDFIDETS